MASIVKAQTNGNDFVISNCDPIDFDIKKIADRKYGVGCDQIIFIKHIVDNKYKIDFYNQDGSLASMCGNGACATALYIKDVLNSTFDEYIFIISEKEYYFKNSGIYFPMPELISSKDGLIIVDTGNKHIVTEELLDVSKLSLEYPGFNYHFIKTTPDGFSIKTFENGVGWTLACGSGAVASTFALGLWDALIKHEGGESRVIFDNNFFVLQAKSQLLFEVRLFF